MGAGGGGCGMEMSAGVCAGVCAGEAEGSGCVVLCSLKQGKEQL